MFTKYARGMVYWADIPKYDTNPNIQSGRRPVIIVSNNVANCFSNSITIVPCTTNIDKNPNQPTHYIMNLSPKEASLVLCEDIITVSKNLLVSFMGMLDEHIMKEIDECIKSALGLVDVPNPLLGNSRKQIEHVETEPKKQGIRISSPTQMREFITFFEQNGMDKTMEKYGVPSKSAVRQRLQFYRKRV